jgi:hypothetical protein
LASKVACHVPETPSASSQGVGLVGVEHKTDDGLLNADEEFVADIYFFFYILKKKVVSPKSQIKINKKGR